MRRTGDGIGDRSGDLTADLNAATPWRRAAIAVTLLMLALHLVAAALTDLDFDEAYYAQWAKGLAWGYVDHPPLVALWIRVSTLVFGDAAFGVRALSVIATALGTVALVTLARLLFPERPALGWIAALLFQAMPLMAVAGFVITPDVPLVTFWTIAVLCLAHVWQAGNAWSWLGVGVAAGFALQSKYSGLFLGAGIVIAMISVPSLRRWFAHPAPYLGGAVALLIFAPVVVWNAGHAWVSFAKQFGRAAGSAYSGRYVPEYFGALAGLAHPVTFAMACGAAWFVWRDRRASSALAPDTVVEVRRLLMALTLPMLLYFLSHALHARVQGNWVAPVFPLLALLAADWATSPPTRRWDVLGRWRALVWGSVVGLMLAAISVVHVISGTLPVSPKFDIALQRLQGWSGLGRDVAAVGRREGAAYVLTTSYALTSHLRFYRANPIVEQMNERARWSSLPTLLSHTDAQYLNSPGLYVAEVGRERLELIKPRFALVERIGEVERTFAGKRLRTYSLYRLRGPTAPQLSPPSFRLPL